MKYENFTLDEFELRRKSLKMFLLQGYFSNAFELLDENSALLNSNLNEITNYSKRKFKDLESKREAKKELQISNKIDQIIMQSARTLSETLLLIQDFSSFKLTNEELMRNNQKILGKYKEICKQFKYSFKNVIIKIQSQSLQLIECTKNSINVTSNNQSKLPENELQEVFINAPKLNEIDYLESVIDYRDNQIKLIEKVSNQIEELNTIIINLNSDEQITHSNKNVDISIITIENGKTVCEENKGHNKSIIQPPFLPKTVLITLIGILVLLILMAVSK